MAGLDHVKPFNTGFRGVTGETVLEERFEGGFFLVVGGVGDEADQTTWGVLVRRYRDSLDMIRKLTPDITNTCIIISPRSTDRKGLTHLALQ